MARTGHAVTTARRDFSRPSDRLVSCRGGSRPYRQHLGAVIVLVI